MADDDRTLGEGLADLIRQIGGEEELAAQIAATEFPTDDPDFQRGMQEGLAIGVLVGRAVAICAAEPSPLVRAAADAFARAWTYVGLKLVEMGAQLQGSQRAHQEMLDQIQTLVSEAPPPPEPRR